MDEKMWICILKCQVCGRELNRSHPVPECDKTRVVISAPLMGICPVISHNTLSDCNIGVDIQWVEASEAPAMRADIAGATLEQLSKLLAAGEQNG